MALIATAQEVEFTAATPSQNPPKFPIKILGEFSGKKQWFFSDFWWVAKTTQLSRNE
jgi:hypothetical protein